MTIRTHLKRYAEALEKRAVIEITEAEPAAAQVNSWHRNYGYARSPTASSASRRNSSARPLDRLST